MNVMMNIKDNKSCRHNAIANAIKENSTPRIPVYNNPIFIMTLPVINPGTNIPRKWHINTNETSCVVYLNISIIKLIF